MACGFLSCLELTLVSLCRVLRIFLFLWTIRHKHVSFGEGNSGRKHSLYWMAIRWVQLWLLSRGEEMIPCYVPFSYTCSQLLTTQCVVHTSLGAFGNTTWGSNVACSRHDVSWNHRPPICLYQIWGLARHIPFERQRSLKSSRRS